ncbi:hypothetical protein COS16_07305 [Candidatus Desantisbacteria bacterium CG02_land_8_20_14_3_00_49_13]|nr:MAG: hypothetical protein COS16_07305 [Candidatus Desantisbacteria bacterium CG02_land_8_20_14_3_00_49_13]
MILKALYKWNQDKDVFQVAEKIALNEDLKKYFGHPGDIRQNSWQLYLKGSMRKQGIDKEKDSAKYLLDFVEDVQKKGVASESLEQTKIKAARSILGEYDESMLSSLHKELESEYLKELKNSKGKEPNRCVELSSKKSLIEVILREKSKKEK